MMWKGINGEIAGTLDASYHKGCGERMGIEREVDYLASDCVGRVMETEKSTNVPSSKDRNIILIEMTSTKNTIVTDGTCPTLTSRMGTGGNQVNAVLTTNSDAGGKSATKAFAMQAFGVYREGEQASSVKARDHKDATDLVVMATGQANAEIMTDGCPTLNNDHDQPVLMQKSTMTSNVRRLTPKEAERLQGFPDGWTDIGEWIDSNGKKRKAADSPRYRALGNSIATPFWFVLLRRISAQYERPATMGSLFSGIGGFEYCWVRCNGTKTVLWASEIEEFPIAVTRQHFGDEDLGIEGDIQKYL